MALLAVGEEGQFLRRLLCVRYCRASMISAAYLLFLLSGHLCQCPRRSHRRLYRNFLFLCLRGRDLFLCLRGRVAGVDWMSCPVGR